MCSAALAANAAGATATATFPVSATVIDSCTVDAAPLAFGNYNAISGAMLDSVSNVTPTCTSGTFYNVALNEGLGNGATTSARKLTGTDGASLAYGIYIDTARNTVWGDGAGGTSSMVGYGNGAAQSILMYGRIPAGQAVFVGTYADTITVTLTY